MGGFFHLLTRQTRCNDIKFSFLTSYCDIYLWTIGGKLLNHTTEVLMNKVHEAHIWYHEDVALKHNALASRNLGILREEWN